MTAPQDLRARLGRHADLIEAYLDYGRTEIRGGEYRNIVEDLRAALTRLDHLEEVCDELRETVEVLRPPAQQYNQMQARLDHLERERERFMRIEEVAKKVSPSCHPAHFDRTGQSGLGCPECQRERVVYHELRDALAGPSRGTSSSPAGGGAGPQTGEKQA